MYTISDVAELAGVSVGTVSRVINGAENVRPETRTRVEAAIAKLGYQPNLQARSLRSKRTNTIALAIPELTNYFWTTIARGVQDACQAQGYHVIIYNTNEASAARIQYVESMINRVDGMVLSRRSERKILASAEPSSSEPSTHAREIPIVFVTQSQAINWHVDNVYSDSISGSFALTQHLIHLGHQHIAIVTGRTSSSSAAERVAGYCLALADANIQIKEDLIRWGEYHHTTAEHLTHELIDRNPEITAIVAANNEISIGVMNVLEQRQMHVPEDIAVVCFDDFYPDSRFASIMTVAAQSPYDIGINATQLLLNRLNRDDSPRPRTVVLPTRLIVRQSCGDQLTTPKTVHAFDRVSGQLIPQVSKEKIAALFPQISRFAHFELPANKLPLVEVDKILVAHLKRTLKGKASPQTKIPHFEYAVTNKALYQIILERDPIYEITNQHSEIVPEDQVAFAQRVGLAGIACRFPWQPSIVASDDGWEANNGLPYIDFPPLTDQLDYVDSYVRAALNADVGITVDFRSIVGDTLDIVNAINLVDQHVHNDSLYKVADILLDYACKLVQLICDRFGDDLTFVIFRDQWADKSGLRMPPDVFETIFSQRLQRLLRAAQAHQLPITLHTPGNLEMIVPYVHQLGFDAIFIAQPEINDLDTLVAKAGGNLTFMGSIPMSSLMNGNIHTIEQQFGVIRSLLGQGGRYVAGMSGEINGDVSYQNYFALLHAIQNGST